MNTTNKKLKSHRSGLKTTEHFEGESLESKVRRVTSSGEPIEAISPMLYTERKEGVRADTNIRTDKWDVALNAMDSIAQGRRQKRLERINGISETSEPQK